MAFITQRTNPKTGKKSKIWTIGYTDETGKPRSKSSKTKSKDEATYIMNTKYLPIETNNFNGMNVVKVREKIKIALEYFRDKECIHSKDLEKQKAQKSIQRDKAILNNFISFLENKDIEEFSEVTKSTIEDYIRVWCRDKQEKAQNTLRRELQVVKTFFHWAITKFYLNEADNPCREIKNIKTEEKTPVYFTEDEVKKIFEKAKNPHKKMFQLLYLTGLRIQELLNLKWNDFDAVSNHLIIRKMEGNKAKRETIVNLNKSALEIILEMEKEKEDNVFIFTNSIGNPFEQGKVYNYAIKLYKECEIKKDITQPLHIWRHTCASHLVQKGVSLYTVMEILRHKDIKETMIYAHLSKETIINAIEKLVL